MTTNSAICNLINDFSVTWLQEIENRQIRVKKDSVLPYAIFNYDIGADFSDPVVQEARGIIIDLEKLEVVCWPFRKFGNYTESYADKIDWFTARVQDKIDGSIIKYWFSERLNKWVWSTNSCIYASEANAQNGRSFQKIIEDTLEYEWISHYGELNRNLRTFKLAMDYTYIFELVSPDNQVVLNYPEARLWHIGTRNNKTGEEINISIGVQKPKEFSLHSLEDCVEAAKQLNKNDFPDAEGFVVVDDNWNRIKIKSPEYLIWHHAVNNGNINKETAYALTNSDDFNLDTFKENVSEYICNKVLYYIKAFEESTKNIISMIEKARDLQSKGKTRKEIALEIKSDPYAYYGFKALDSELQPEKLIDYLGEKAFLKTIEDYKDV